MSKSARHELGSVDRGSAVPPFRQIAGHLAKLIEAGDMAAGDRLPSEPQLSKHYGVARMTVRQALDILKADSLIVSEQGRGVFVASASPFQAMPLFAWPASTLMTDRAFPLPDEGDEHRAGLPNTGVVSKGHYRVEGARVQGRSGHMVVSESGPRELVILMESQSAGLVYELHEYRVSPVPELADDVVTREIVKLRDQIARVDKCRVEVTSRAALPHEARRLGLRTSETVTVTERIGTRDAELLVRCTSVRPGRLRLEFEFEVLDNPV